MRDRLLTLCVPLLFVVSMALARAGMGEFWRAPSYDPDYAYLFNSFNVAVGAPPQHVDHPGTPVQMLGAAALIALRAGGEDIARRPEHFMAILAWVLVLLAALALWRFGAAALAAGASPAIVLTAQAAPLLSAEVLLESLMRFNPEPLLLALGLCVAALAVRGADGPGWAVVYGAVCGVGVAAKVNCAPVLVAPLVGLSGWAARGVFLLSAAGSFALCTKPVWSEYGRVFGWFWRLVTHKGLYGSAGPGFADPAVVLRDGLLLAAGTPVLVLALWVGLRAWWRTRGSGHAATRRWVLALSLALAAQWVSVARHARVRYLVPALALSAAVVVLSDRLRPMGRRALGGAGLVTAALFVVGSVPLVTEWRERGADLRVIEAAIMARPECALSAHYRASRQEFALAFGNSYSGGRLSAELKRLYPEFLYHDIFQRQNSLWGEPIDSAELLARRGCLLLQGRELTQRYTLAPGITARWLVKGRREDLRLLE